MGMKTSGLTKFCELLIIPVIGCLTVPSSVQAGDAAAGRTKAVLCAGCHGPNGEGKTDQQTIVPALACQTEAYLNKSMMGYKHGTRIEPTMNAIFKGLSDADIANLAAFYATLK